MHVHKNPRRGPRRPGAPVCPTDEHAGGFPSVLRGRVLPSPKPSSHRCLVGVSPEGLLWGASRRRAPAPSRARPLYPWQDPLLRPCRDIRPPRAVAADAPDARTVALPSCLRLPGSLRAPPDGRPSCVFLMGPLWTPVPCPLRTRLTNTSPALGATLHFSMAPDYPEVPPVPVNLRLPGGLVPSRVSHRHPQTPGGHRASPQYPLPVFTAVPSRTRLQAT